MKWNKPLKRRGVNCLDIVLKMYNIKHAKIKRDKEGNIIEFRDVQHNWGLLESRYKNAVNPYVFPVGYRIKPTNHQQNCYLCNNPFNKGEKQIILNAGMQLLSFRSGAKNIVRYSDRFVGVSGNQRAETRLIYVHPQCFSCYLNFVAMKSGLSELRRDSVCNECKNRFQCFTDNAESPFNRVMIR